MGLGGTVIIAGAVGDPDGGHERDARCPGTQRPQDVAHAVIVDTLRPDPARAVGAKGEHHGVHTLDGAGERVGSGHVTDDHLRFARKLIRLPGIAHQSPDGMALPDRFINDKAPDGASRADDQHIHSDNGHDASLLFGVGDHRQYWYS